MLWVFNYVWALLFTETQPGTDDDNAEVFIINNNELPSIMWYTNYVSISMRPRGKLQS